MSEYTNFNYTFDYPGSGYNLGDRVQFCYNGAICQGNVYEILSTGNILPNGQYDKLIIINVDVSNNYSVLPEEYNNLQISIFDSSLIKIPTQSWY